MEKEERNTRMGEHTGIRNEVKIQTIKGPLWWKLARRPRKF